MSINNIHQLNRPIIQITKTRKIRTRHQRKLPPRDPTHNLPKRTQTLPKHHQLLPNLKRAPPQTRIPPILSPKKTQSFLTQLLNTFKNQIRNRIIFIRRQIQKNIQHNISRRNKRQRKITMRPNLLINRTSQIRIALMHCNKPPCANKHSQLTHLTLGNKTCTIRKIQKTKNPIPILINPSNEPPPHGAQSNHAHSNRNTPATP